MSSSQNNHKGLGLKNNGFSILEVLIAGSIGMIVMLAITSMVSTQQTEVRSLQQKLEVVELKSTLIKSLSNAQVCTWQFQALTIDVTDATPLVPGSTSISLPALRQGSSVASPIIVSQGEKIPLSNYGLKVDKISLGKFVSTGLADEYQGVLEVSFQSSSLARPLRALEMRQVLKTQASDPPNAKRIISCATGTGSGLACVTGSLTGKTDVRTIVNGAGYTPASFDEIFRIKPGSVNINSWGLACQPGWTLTGCTLNGDGAVSSSGSAPSQTQDWDLRMDSNGFCKSDSEEYDMDALITVICCRAGS